MFVLRVSDWNQKIKRGKKNPKMIDALTVLENYAAFVLFVFVLPNL